LNEYMYEVRLVVWEKGPIENIPIKLKT